MRDIRAGEAANGVRNTQLNEHKLTTLTHDNAYAPSSSQPEPMSSSPVAPVLSPLPPNVTSGRHGLGTRSINTTHSRAARRLADRRKSRSPRPNDENLSPRPFAASPKKAVSPVGGARPTATAAAAYIDAISPKNKLPLSPLKTVSPRRTIAPCPLDTSEQRVLKVQAAQSPTLLHR